MCADIAGVTAADADATKVGTGIIGSRLAAPNDLINDLLFIMLNISISNHQKRSVDSCFHLGQYY